MSDQTIESRLIDVISDQLGVGKADVTPVADFTTDLGGDSLDGVELVMAVEEEFDIEIDAKSGAGLRTLQDFVALVTKLTAEG